MQWVWLIYVFFFWFINLRIQEEDFTVTFLFLILFWARMDAFDTNETNTHESHHRRSAPSLSFSHSKVRSRISHKSFFSLFFAKKNNQNRSKYLFCDEKGHVPTTQRLVIAFDRIGVDVHVQIFSGNSLVQAEQVVAVRFEVGCGVEGLADEAVVIVAVADRFHDGGDAGEALQDGSQDLESRCHVFIRVGLFGDRGDDGDVDALRRDLERVAQAADEDVVDASHLRSRDDDLNGLGVVGVRHWMVEKADASDDAAGWADLVLGEVGRVPDDHLGGRHLVSGLDTVCLAVLHEDLVNILVEHEGSSVDGADAGEALWESAQAVDRVDVRGSSVPLQRVHVHLEVLDGWQRRLVHVGLVELQAHGMGNELVRVGLHAERGVELAHGHGGQIAALVGGGIRFVVLVDEDEELAESTLFEDSHEG
mmetsp:Transcript_21882/g.62364  ORF Transcript_21882/g.62364 Transcript_21882/m.62364 type:complete len:422 (+) Transcript_21882:43-1308(+)